MLEGDDRVVLKLHPGITGPATLKYRLEDKMIAAFVECCRTAPFAEFRASYPDVEVPEDAFDGLRAMEDQDLAVWYNDNVIYPDKVRLNKYYYHHYSFWKDLAIIFATVFGRKVWFGGEEI